MQKNEQKVENFLQYLENQLDEKNLSVPQFADLMGIPRATVYTWLNRKSVMGLDMYYKALEVLGVEEKLFNPDNISV